MRHINATVYESHQCNRTRQHGPCPTKESPKSAPCLACCRRFTQAGRLTQHTSSMSLLWPLQSLTAATQAPTATPAAHTLHQGAEGWQQKCHVFERTTRSTVAGNGIGSSSSRVHRKPCRSPHPQTTCVYGTPGACRCCCQHSVRQQTGGAAAQRTRSSQSRRAICRVQHTAGAAHRQAAALNARKVCASSAPDRMGTATNL